MTDTPNRGGTEVFIHITRSPAGCDHVFTGWREFDNGCGGEAVCSNCGMGAMAHTLWSDPT